MFLHIIHDELVASLRESLMGIIMESVQMIPALDSHLVSMIARFALVGIKHSLTLSV
jgi:hypothetical protein